MRYLKVIVSSKAGSTLSSAAFEAARRVISTYTDIVPIGVRGNLYGRHIVISFCVQIATDVKLLSNIIHEASNHITAVVSFEPGESFLSNRFVISDYTDPGVGRFYAEYLVKEEAAVNTKATALIEGVAQAKKRVFTNRAMLRIKLHGVFVLRMVLEKVIMSVEVDIDVIRSCVRPWGYWEVLHIENGAKVKRIVLAPGKSISLQRHEHREETWVIINGVGRVEIGDTIYGNLRSGDSVYIAAGEWHRVTNTSDDEYLTIIETQTGPILSERDIERKD